MSIKLEWTISRKSTIPDQPAMVSNSIQSLLPIGPNREIIADFITGNETENMAILPNLLPKFVKVTSRGTANVINQLMWFGNYYFYSF